MQGKPRFILLGAAFLSVLSLGAVETARASVVPSSAQTTAKSATGQTTTERDPYDRGYRAGITQGMRDARTDCSRRGYQPRAHLRRSVPTQFMSGWMTGYNEGFRRVCR